MKNQIKDLTDSNLLRGWLDSVPRCEYNKHKMGLVVACAVYKHTFLNWLYGRCRVPNSAKKLINAYTLQVSGRELFPLPSEADIATAWKQAKQQNDCPLQNTVSGDE